MQLRGAAHLPSGSTAIADLIGRECSRCLSPSNLETRPTSTSPPRAAHRLSLAKRKFKQNRAGTPAARVWRGTHAPKKSPRDAPFIGSSSRSENSNRPQRTNLRREFEGGTDAPQKTPRDGPPIGSPREAKSTDRVGARSIRPRPDGRREALPAKSPFGVTRRRLLELRRRDRGRSGRGGRARIFRASARCSAASARAARPCVAR